MPGTVAHDDDAPQARGLADAGDSRQRRFVLRPFLLFLVAVAASACTTFNNARPLEPGQHAASVTLGGPLTNIPGVGPIPLPNVTLEGRHGIIHHLDVNYGLHVLPMVFGVAGAHVGATGLLFDQPNQWVPALSLGQRFFFFTNILDGRKERKDAFAMSQTDLSASWEIYDQLLYVGATGYLPINGTFTPRFAPVLGVEVHPGIDWLRIQIETRWLSPDVDQRFAVVNWIAPNDQGAITLNVGFAVVLSDLFGGQQTHAPPEATTEPAVPAGTEPAQPAATEPAATEPAATEPATEATRVKP